MVQRYYRKIIHISAEDTPNVRLALAQEAAGIEPTNEIVVPGVLTWEEFKYRRRTWDKVRQRVGLDGKFWDGSESLLYPPHWLNRAERLHIFLKGRSRIARAMGIDSGEGAANTSWSIVDELGLIKQVSKKTPNTDVIIRETIDLIHEFKIPFDRVAFDRGGGGKQHADRLRAMGYNVRTIAFNEKVSVVDRRTKTPFKEKIDVKERKYSYLNKRAEMYGELRILLDPGSDTRDYDNELAWKEIATDKGRLVGDIIGFALPPEYTRLREQLAPIPYLEDGERRMYLPPKNKKNPQSTERTMIDIVGYSPDDADSLVMALSAMQVASSQVFAGGL